MKRGIPICLGLILSAVMSSSAGAETNLDNKPTNPEAQAAEKQAKRLAEVGKMDEAIETYKAGYIIEANARFLYNLATVCYLDSRHEEAIAWIAKLKDKYRDLDAESAESVEALLVDIKAQQAKQAEEALAKQAAQREKQAANKAAAALEKQVPDGAATSVNSRQAGPPPWHHDILGWSLVGVGTASIISGTLLLQNTANLREDANAPDTEQIERDELRGRADSRQTIGIIALATGGAIVLGGIIKLALVPEAPASISIAPTADGGAFATITGTW